MAKMNKAVLGNFGGKVGNVVGRKFRTEAVVAAYQPVVANPRTLAQRMIRARLALASQLSNAMAFSINNGLLQASRGTKWSPRNVFVKLNFENVTGVAPDSLTVNYTNLVLSKGSLLQPSFGAPQFDNPQEVEVSYDFAALPGTPSDYRVNLCVYSPDVDNSALKTVTPSAFTGTINFVVPQSFNGMAVKVYGWLEYVGEDMGNYGVYKNAVCNSVYVGSGTIA